jgi:CBS domain-containing protein
MERTSSFEPFFEVRRQFEQHPWLMIGAATVAGVVAGHIATSLARELLTTPSSRTLGRSFRHSGEPMTAGKVSGPEDSRQEHGFFSDLGKTFEKELRVVKEMAISAARDVAKATLPPALGSQIAEVFDSATSKLATWGVEGGHNGGSTKHRSNGGQRVRDIMTTDPVCCIKDTSLTDVARLMVEHDCGAVPVVESNDNGRLVGVVTDRDIVCRTLANGEDPYQMAAGDCMSSAPITVRPETSLEECARKMEQHQLRRILVLDASGRCCGIVAQADLARHADKARAGDVVKNVSQSGELAFGAI